VEDVNIAEDSRAGEIRYHRHEIAVMPQLRPLVRTQILWHEAIHVLLHQAGQREHEEALVDLMAYGIMQVLRDNPDLVKETLYDVA
jgi:hypothetical protein